MTTPTTNLQIVADNVVSMITRKLTPLEKAEIRTAAEIRLGRRPVVVEIPVICSGCFQRPVKHRREKCRQCKARIAYRRRGKADVLKAAKLRQRLFWSLVAGAAVIAFWTNYYG